MLTWATDALRQRRAAMRPSLLLRCGCGNILALRERGRWEVRHRGRRLYFRDLVAVICEDCGASTKSR